MSESKLGSTKWYNEQAKKIKENITDLTPLENIPESEDKDSGTEKNKSWNDVVHELGKQNQEDRLKEAEARNELLKEKKLEEENPEESEAKISNTEEKKKVSLRKMIGELFTNKKEKPEEEIPTEEEFLSKKASQIGANIEELEKDENWKELTNGQKMLALEQMSQNTLLNVKNIGEERFKKSLEGLGVIKKIGKNLRKSYFISQEEKQVLEEVREGKISPDKDSGDVIIKHLKELNLDTYISELGGKPIIEFAKEPQNCPEELYGKLDDYNRIANNFSKIPARFGDPTLASKKELKQYREAEEKFKNAQSSLIEEQSKFDAEFTVLDNIADQEFKMRALQSKIESPDAFKALDKIENELSWGRIANNENILKLGYAGAGFVLRTGIKGTVGLAAAPIVGAAVGLWKGINNGNKKIKEEYLENKSGETRRERMERLKEQTQDLENKLRDEFAKPKEEQNKELIGSLVAEIEGIKNKDKIDSIIDAEDSIEKLKKLISRFEKTTNSEKKILVYGEVLRRINFIEDKNKKGLINFGDKNGLALKYNLFKNISEATVKLESNFYTGVTKDDEFNELLIKDHSKYKDKLYDLAAKNENKFDKKKKEIKNKEIKKAVIMGATFATLGAGLRHFYEYVDSGTIVNNGVEGLKKMFGVGTNVLKNTSDGYEAFKYQMFSEENNSIPNEENITETSTNKKIGWSQERPDWAKEPVRPEYNPKLKSDEEVNKEILSSLALVKKGDGVTNPLARQIEEMLKNEDQAKALGFDGKNAHKFAIKKAAELAKEYGYIKPDGSEVRLGTNSIGHASYEVKMINGKLAVNETFDGKDMTEGNIDKEYEYSYKKEVKVSTNSESSATPETSISKADPMSKFSKLYIENLRNQPLYEQLKNEKVSDILNNPLAAKEFELIKSMEVDIKKSTGIDINPKTNETLKTYLDRLTEELNTNEKVLKTTKGVLPDFKVLQDKNNPEWIEAGKPTADGETKLAQDIINDKKSNLGKQLKQYHDYVKAETGKDIAVKSDDTAETYKKSLDEALKSSGKSIPTETVEDIKTKVSDKVSDIEKANIKKINPNELIGQEKLVELDKLQKKVLEHFDENAESLKEISSRKEFKEIENLLIPSDSNHMRIVLQGSSPDQDMARNLSEQDYRINSINLKANPNNFTITKDLNKNIHIESEGRIYYHQEITSIKEFLYQDRKTGNYYAYKIVEIEKPHKFTPSEFMTPPEKVTPPLTKDSELKLKLK